MSRELIIVAAGKSTRFGGQPKYLQEISPGITNLKNTISKFSKYFSKITVLASEEHKGNDAFNSVSAYVNFMPSGGGDGLALKRHLNHRIPYNEVCVVWGDAVFQDSRIIEEIIYRKHELDVVKESWDCIIPANMKSDPYVRFIASNDYPLPAGLKRVRGVQFSKYNEVDVKEGYHDQCIFYFKAETLNKIISETLEIVYVNGKVILRNGEYTILDSLHRMKTFLYQTNYLTLSYNTPEELDEIYARFNTTT